MGTIACFSFSIVKLSDSNSKISQSISLSVVLSCSILIFLRSTSIFDKKIMAGYHVGTCPRLLRTAANAEQFKRIMAMGQLISSRFKSSDPPTTETERITFSGIANDLSRFNIKNETSYTEKQFSVGNDSFSLSELCIPKITNNIPHLN
jgi:hypothetical protein